MMYIANTIFFNNTKKIGRPEHLLPPTPLKVDVICVSPLTITRLCLCVKNKTQVTEHAQI